LRQKRKSDRIMSTRLVTPNRTYNVVSTYAPQQGCGDAEKERFWNVTENEELILAGDMVMWGKIGVRNGHGGKGESSQGEGMRKESFILDLARRKDLAILHGKE